ncbi:HNH endonuclease signature motif containing protein [Pseudoclavibacter sp. AY1F1]|uniref:HNH endonuclease signature motif containing protein n=1 Tax=Pseudoclavibacter sp. AY1F1 TaxID=2080583 RepID=UPI0015E2CE5D|nr:HNH endonuclease signature motif containing protein [Pseudoclavibacter sp. AY1F1]
MASQSEQETHHQSSQDTAVVDTLLESRCQLAGLPDAEILVVLRELAARRRILDAALVEVTGELARREDESPRAETVARKSGFRNLQAMLEQVLAVKPFEAKTLVQVAAATRERMSVTGEPIPPKYVAVSRAVGSGVMSVAQASAITKGLDHTGNRVDVDELARAEVELVASACGLNPEDEQPAVPKVLEVQAATWVSYLDPDGDEPRADKIAEERGLWIAQRGDGAVVGKFIATPEQGEQLLSVFDALLSPRRKVEFPATSDCGEPTAPVLGPDGLPPAANQGVSDWVGSDPDGSDPDGSDLDGSDSDASDSDGSDSDGSDEILEVPVVDPRSIEQRRIDALDMILRCYAESPDAPRTGGEAPTIVIVTAETGLVGEAERPEDVPHLERTGEPIPPSFAAKTMCDGFIRIATRTATGEILDLGRKQRLFTTAQRRAIFVRDRSCRAPGCGAPARWCEAHHARPWSEGGVTDVRDGILLCSFHHHEVHRDRLTLILRPNGRWSVVATVGHHVRRRNPRRRTSESTDAPHPEWNRRT